MVVAVASLIQIVEPHLDQSRIFDHRNNIISKPFFTLILVLKTDEHIIRRSFIAVPMRSEVWEWSNELQVVKVPVSYKLGLTDRPLPSNE